MIKKHGQIIGEERFNDYKKKQAYSGVAEKYFIDKLGEEEGKLDGILCTIKDCFEVKGWKTKIGSLQLKDKKDDEIDAPCVTRIKEQNGIIIGKTTCPSFCWEGFFTFSHNLGITESYLQG